MAKVDVYGVEIHYEQYGEGFPVILIASYGADHFYFGRCYEALAEQNKVILLDNRGVGQSSVSKDPYTVKMMAADVIAVLDYLNIEQAHILGSSLGGNIAQWIAYHYPQYCRSLVLCNTFTSLDYRVKLLTELHLELKELEVSQELLTKFFLLWCFSEDYLKKNYMEIMALALSVAKQPSLQGLKSQFAALADFDSHTWIHKIKVPSLIITADEDLIASKAGSEKLAKLIKGSEYYCFKSTGHMPQFERPGEFVSLLQKFWKPFE